MVRIVLVDPEAQTNASLLRTLAHCGGVFYVENNRLQEHGIGKPQYCLCSLPHPAGLQLNNALVCFLQEPDEKALLAGTFCALLLATDTSARLQQHCSQVIRCGMRGEDDICLTSFGEQQSVLSVGRTLFRLDGSRLHPGDFCVRHQSAYSETELLLAGSVLLLTQEFAAGVVVLP